MLKVNQSVIKQYLLSKGISFSEQQVNVLHKTYFKLQYMIGLLYGSDLHRLANQYEAGKPYWYLDIYDKHFKKIRNKKLNILEIGIGGYTAPKAGGGSLRMWQNYFPNSTIHGIDIYNKEFHEDTRIKVYQGSQTDISFLHSLVEKVGKFDIVIDDGSHINEHVIFSFETLFPYLSPNGIYVVEDTHTSYWESFGGSTDKEANTMMNYFRGFIDKVNYEEFNEKDYVPSLYETCITAIHFYHSVILIEKGDNTKGSIENGKLNSY
ncbi:MAG: hypothetical protein ACKPDM_12260 [Dolichospermum sp.]